MFEAVVVVVIINLMCYAGLQDSDCERIIACPNSVINLLTLWHQLSKHSNPAAFIQQNPLYQMYSKGPM